MMRIMLAAFALCAALILSLGVFGSTPAEAGYYRHHNYGGGYYRGYRGRTVYRNDYYGGRGYYGNRGTYGGYRTAYYGRPTYGTDYPEDGGYYNSSGDDGYDGDGYSGGGYYGGYGYGGGCRTAYIPYGWRWYRATSC